MRQAGAAALGAWLAIVPAAPPVRAQAPPVIETVEVQNNQYLQRETILFYISTKPGDAYDEAKLREDFRRLWDTGFLDDLQVEVVDGQRGKVVRFKVTERKRIQIVDYRGSKELTTSTIEDALSEAFIRGQIRGGRPIEVGVKDGGLWYQQGEQGGALSS